MKSKLLRVLVILVSAFALILMPVSAVSAAEAVVNTRSRDVSGRIAGVVVKGEVPVCEGLNLELDNIINEKVGAFYDSVVASYTDSARSIAFSYKAVEYEQYYSLLVYANVTSVVSPSLVFAVCVDTENERIVNLADVLGPNGVKLANDFISLKVAQTKGYNANFTGINAQAKFYIDGGSICFPFDKYAIAAGSLGVVELVLPLEDCVNLTVMREDYYLLTQYNVKMIRLSQVVESFGYTLSWKQDINAVAVNYGFEEFITIAYGKNSYQIRGQNVKILEAAPAATDARTYVPISFFSEIMGLHYSINSDGDITFSQYIAHRE